MAKINLHPFSNGRNYGWGKTRSLFDFFFPEVFDKALYGHQLVRHEADTYAQMENCQQKVTQRDFFTFRAFARHYWGALLDEANKKDFWRESFGVPAWQFGMIGAVAFDAVTNGQSCSACTSLTFAHTVTGTNPFAFTNSQLGGTHNQGATGATYAGAALTASTQNPHSTTGVTDSHDVFYKIGSATGSNNFVISATGASPNIYALGASYSGVQQIGAQTAYSEATATASISHALTKTIGAAFVVWAIVSDAGNSYTAGANTTLRSNSAASATHLLDSGSEGGTGSLTLNATSTSQKCDAILFEISSTAPGTTYTQTLTENVTETDTVVKATTRNLSENITETDSILKATSRALTEAVTAADSILKSIQRTLIESFSITDSIVNLLNAVRTIWTRDTKNTTTWTPDSKNTTDWDFDDKSG